ncbi:transposase [Nitrosococcus halophilus]|uniref:transposase n=1 Tax=Nitrosococcus halophilus TaxID=133539 RepID=UPI0002F0A2E5|nr:transposase [Nitrosococcus halophilus]
MKRQKDLEARWPEKNGQKYYGDKDHLVIDNEPKLIRDFELTSAEVHDSQVFFRLLGENISKAVWADSAHRSEENELVLKAGGYHRKGYRHRLLHKQEKEANRRKSQTRACIEYVFGSMENEMGACLSG